VNALLLFAAAFGVVFALGFQSRNVNTGQYKSAFLTSFIIGVSNLVVLKMVPDTNSMMELAAYMCGGPLGIVASMWAHDKFMGVTK
jgi:hypothetical protein